MSRKLKVEVHSNLKLTSGNPLVIHGEYEPTSPEDSGAGYAAKVARNGYQWWNNRGVISFLPSHSIGLVRIIPFDPEADKEESIQGVATEKHAATPEDD